MLAIPATYTVRVHLWVLALLAAPPPEEAAVRALFEVRTLAIAERRATLGVELPPSVDLDALPADVENRFELAAGALAAFRPEVERIDFLVAHPGTPLRAPGAAKKRAASARPRVEAVLPDPARFPFGLALRGKTIALSPGHGWIYYDNLGRYATQRGNVRWTGCGDCRGITEDFETSEIVRMHLVPLLEGAGARVIMVRERASSAAGAIADTVTEAQGTFTAGTGEGAYGSGYRTSTDPMAIAEWRIRAPVAGPQLLSTWFVSSATNRADARLSVSGPFGAHELPFDQTRHGRRWTPIEVVDVDLGTELVVRLEAPPGAMADRAIVADAVRLGAGTHSSGHPWWQMGAEPFTDYQAAPADVRAAGDVTTRPRYAEFYGADVYLSLHSNASGAADSTAAGSSSYRFNCLRYADHSNAPPAADCDDPPGSDRLLRLVHGRMVEEIRRQWDPEWRDRGPKVANFGELRDLDGIPGVLVESGFHDNVRLAEGSTLEVTDNQAIHDPRWRRAAAFGLYRGLTEFLAPGAPVVLPPPSALALRRAGADRVTLAIGAVPGAQGYRVYLAKGGRTFDQGRVVTATVAVLEGLAPDVTVLARVASLNAAGEGPASAIVCARPSARAAQLLLVDGYTREDAWVQEQDNRHDTLMVHGLALEGFAFDGATEAALGGVDLGAYGAVVLAFGRESTADGILTEALRARVAAFAAAGGAVWADGTEIGWTLGARGDAGTRAWLDQLFGAAYASDDASSRSARAAPGGWLAGALTSTAVTLDDGTGGAVESRSPDVFTAASGTIELTWPSGAAAVRRDRSMVVGFALDSVPSPRTRTELLTAWATRALPALPTPDGGVIVDSGTAVDGGFVAPDTGVAAEDAEPLPLDAGLADAAPAPEDAATPPAPDASDPPRHVRKVEGADAIRGGCGCTTTGAHPAHGLLALCAALALARRRVSQGARERGRRRAS